MKVVQLLPELNEGGVERGVVELNREFVSRGVESIVVSAGGKQADQIATDGGLHVNIDVVSKNPLTAPLRVLQLRKLLHGLEPDILHARSRVPAWLAYLANKSLKLPFVTTVHGFNSVNAYSRVMTYGDKIICVSNAIKAYIQENYQVPAEKITVIPRGIDLDLFNPENINQRFIETFKQQFSLEGRYLVTAVGRVTQLKDYETFIRGLVTAQKRIPQLCGLIVGGVREDKRNYFESLQALVRELKADDFIRFVGSQSNVAEIYSLSDVVVVSSRKPESFGRSAAEALAMNVPVIATNHGGLLDVVLPEKTGYLFTPQNSVQLADAICLCREKTWQRARPFIQNRFSLAQMVEATEGIYHQLMES